jgi:hypothetical protein
VSLKPTIGAYPKAQSASSQRVQGLQLATVTAETSMSRQKKRRTRHQAKEQNELGTIVCNRVGKKNAICMPPFLEVERRHYLLNQASLADETLASFL